MEISSEEESQFSEILSMEKEKYIEREEFFLSQGPYILYRDHGLFQEGEECLFPRIEREKIQTY
jgi:hypothetical protein